MIQVGQRVKPLAVAVLSAVFLSVAIVAFGLTDRAAAQSEPALAPQHFPTIVAQNIDGDDVAYPSGLAGQVNLVLLGFLREHQAETESWGDFATVLSAEQPGFAGYQMPVLAGLPGIAKFGIRAGFRGNVTDPARRQTLTLYFCSAAEKAALKSALAIDSDNDAVAVLIDADGTVLWRAVGTFTDAKGAALEAAVVAALES